MPLLQRDHEFIQYVRPAVSGQQQRTERRTVDTMTEVRQNTRPVGPHKCTYYRAADGCETVLPLTYHSLVHYRVYAVRRISARAASVGA